MFFYYYKYVPCDPPMCRTPLVGRPGSDSISVTNPSRPNLVDILYLKINLLFEILNPESIKSWYSMKF